MAATRTRPVVRNAGGWAARAAEAGAGSSLSIGLPVHDTVTGVLNIYALDAKASAVLRSALGAVTARADGRPAV